jgi:hypothetical protein
MMITIPAWEAGGKISKSDSKKLALIWRCGANKKVPGDPAHPLSVYSYRPGLRGPELKHQRAAKSLLNLIR